MPLSRIASLHADASGAHARVTTQRTSPLTHAGSSPLSGPEVTVLDYTIERMPSRPPIAGVGPPNDSSGGGLSEPVARGPEDTWRPVLDHVPAEED